MVEGHLEAGEVGQVGLPHRRDQVLLATALGPGPDHDRRAVGVIGAEIDHLVAAELLKPYEDIRLDVLDEVPEMDMPVGVGERRGDEDAALG